MSFIYFEIFMSRNWKILKQIKGFDLFLVLLKKLLLIRDIDYPKGFHVDALIYQIKFKGDQIHVFRDRMSFFPLTSEGMINCYPQEIQ